MDEKPLQPEQWESLAAAPIIPGISHGPNPAPPFPTQQLGNYFISPLTSDIQHDGLFVRTGYQTFGAPRIPLMPLSPAGNAQNNVVNETIIQNSSGGSVFTITGLVFSGTWNSFTNYVANDVVLSSGALYVASSSSTNQTPASSPAFWTQLAGTGSVTSVALTMPSIFSVAGSPILTAGTLAVTLATEAASKVFAGPASGPDAAPSFRLLAASELSNGTIGSGKIQLVPQVVVDTTPVSKNANTTGDQDLMSDTLLADSLNSLGRTLHVWGAGLYSCVAGVGSITVKVWLGSLLVVSWTTSNPPAATDHSWNFNAWITTTTAGASGAFEVHGSLRIDLNVNPGQEDSTYTDTNTTTVGTANTTGTLNLKVTMSFDAADTGNIATQRQMIGTFWK